MPEPADAKPQQNPAKAFFEFICTWPVIGSFAMVIGGGIWSRISDSIFGDILLVIGLCCVFFLVAHKLWVRPLLKFGVPGILSCCAIGTALWVTRSRAPEDGAKARGPDLSLILRSPSLPNFELPLTDRALLVDMDRMVVAFTNHLYFPVKSTNTPLTLRMLVRNWPKDGKTAAEGFTVGVTYSESVECTFGPGWEAGESGTIGFNQIMYRGDNVTLYAKSGKILTDIAFKPRHGWSGWVATESGMGQNPSKFGLVLSLFGKDMERKTIPFTVLVPVFPSMSPVEPRILLKGDATNLNFTWSTNEP